MAKVTILVCDNHPPGDVQPATGTVKLGGDTVTVCAKCEHTLAETLTGLRRRFRVDNGNGPRMLPCYERAVAVLQALAESPHGTNGPALMKALGVSSTELAVVRGHLKRLKLIGVHGAKLACYLTITEAGQKALAEHQATGRIKAFTAPRPGFGSGSESARKAVATRRATLRQTRRERGQRAES